MNKDLLSSDFTHNIDISKIDRNIGLIKVVIILGSTYSILEIWRWMKLFLSNTAIYLTIDNIYYVLVFILATIPLAVLFIISWLWYLKANKLMKLSIQNNDSVVFNKAYALINRSSILSILGSCISLLSMLVALFVE